MARPVKYYADEHIGRAVVNGLRQRGIDVLTLVDAGMLGATDREHLQRATTEGRVVLTQDADFLRLHSEGLRHAGIVYASQGTAAGDLIRGALLVAEVLDLDDMIGHIEFI